MRLWTLKCFCGAGGREIFDQEYASKPTATRAEFRAVLNGLLDQPDIRGWSRPAGFDRLSGIYRDLGKLRFKADNTQHRPLGFFGPGKMEFTLLIWATERGGNFYPRNVRDTALARMAIVLSDHVRAHVCDF